MLLRALILVIFAFSAFSAVAADPAYAALDRAYTALRVNEYEAAIAAFEAAIKASPARADIRKDLAYTLLKAGDTTAARDQFAEAIRLDPSDIHTALEYAYLCYETKMPAEARRVFDRVRKLGNATAAEAFENIDRPLREGIDRWKRAVALAPDNYSSHEELARLAEERGDLELAVHHYERAWQLKPANRQFLLALGRIRKAQNMPAEAHAALLAASRGAEPYVAEFARELLPGRYPYVYEFERAIELDSANVPLRRELAYLHLEMGSSELAEAQFRRIIELAPDDLLSVAQIGFVLLKRRDLAGATPLLERALQSEDDEMTDRIRSALQLPRTLRKRPETPRSQTSAEAKQLAQRSLEAGYLKDALKYLQIAHENDPIDFGVMLKLGWTNNILKNDPEAVRWFNLAGKSPDPKIATEANRASANLRPTLARYRTSAWLFPFYSSRWQGAFTYGQVKTETRLGRSPFRVYLSSRFVGDTQGKTQTKVLNEPGYLSETAFILGGGFNAGPWKGVVVWGEAGAAVSYKNRHDVGRVTPDYRAGVFLTRSFGRNIGGERHGIFYETNLDGVFISRFENDFLVYSQNRSGYTLPSIGALQLQAHWTTNLTADLKRLYWANTIEHGPGIRLRFKGMPPSLLFSVQALSGRYTILTDNPYGPRYTDLRAGFWYAFSR